MPSVVRRKSLAAVSLAPTRESHPLEEPGVTAARLLAGSACGKRSREDLDLLATKLSQLSYFNEPARRAMLTGELMQQMAVRRVSTGSLVLQPGEDSRSSLLIVLAGTCSVHVRQLSPDKPRRSPPAGSMRPGSSSPPRSLLRSHTSAALLVARSGSSGAVRPPASLSRPPPVAGGARPGVRDRSLPRGSAREAMLGPAVGAVRPGEAVEARVGASVVAAAEVMVLSVEIQRDAAAEQAPPAPHCPPH